MPNPSERTRRVLQQARQLLTAGDAAAARAALEALLAENSSAAEAWMLLGEACSRCNDHPRALQCFEQATQRQDGNADAWFNLGVAQAALGSHVEAIQAYAAAIQRADGDYPDALRNMGWCFIQLEQYEQACQALDAYLGAFPPNREVFVLLGLARQALQRCEEAAQAYREALALGADDYSLQLNLGACLQVLHDYQAAAEHAARALDHRPGDAVAAFNLATAYFALGRIREARETFARVPRADAEISSLAALSYQDPLDIGALAEAHRQWGRRMVEAAGVPPPLAPRPAAGRRLRLGFVSADFRQHPVAFFIEGLLRRLDRSRFELVLYFDAPNRDAMTEGFQSIADRWVELHPYRDDDEAAALVRADGIDILFDLGGMTSDRIAMFARRIAPVQASYLGYACTTGLPTMDWFLTDSELDPEGSSEPWYSESLLRLGRCFATYTPPLDAPEAAPRAAGAPCLASVARLNKISDATLELWAAAMRAVPEASLIVLAHGLQNATTRQLFRQRLLGNGIDPERVEMLGSLKLADYFALHRRIDLLLDTTPWSGHTTTLHGLWMGVPTVAIEQPHHAGRFSAMVMRNAGLPEFVAGAGDEFGARVAALLADRALLARVREQGRDLLRASVLTDHAGLAQRFGEACETMWRRAQDDGGTAAKPHRELLIGCGASREKRLSADNDPVWKGLTTLDVNPEHAPDVVWDLAETRLPFDDDSFDEIHAYEVLEHTGSQGDYRFFFAQFSDFWRVLKPGGLLLGTTPAFDSPWAWGDPSHTRVISQESLTFLDQTEYERQVGVTAMSDFRYLYQADFQLLATDKREGSFQFILRAIKPSRIVPLEQRRCRQRVASLRAP